MDEKTKYIINFASKINYTTFDAVMSRSSKKPLPMTRRMLVYLLFSYGMSIDELSETFHFVSSYIRKMINLHKSQFKNDAMYKERYMKLKNECERRKWKK